MSGNIAKIRDDITKSNFYSKVCNGIPDTDLFLKDIVLYSFCCKQDL